jgi:hypothetical protein
VFRPDDHSSSTRLAGCSHLARKRCARSNHERTPAGERGRTRPRSHRATSQCSGTRSLASLLDWSNRSSELSPAHASPASVGPWAVRRAEASCSHLERDVFVGVDGVRLSIDHRTLPAVATGLASEIGQASHDPRISGRRRRLIPADSPRSGSASCPDPSECCSEHRVSRAVRAVQDPRCFRR